MPSREHLEHLAHRCQELLLHESRFVVERSNTFLSTNAILFAGFILLASSEVGQQSWWALGLRAGVAFFGLILCVAQPLVLGRTLAALDFWRNTLALIEMEPEYGGSSNEDQNEDQSKDLDLISARARHWRGENTRQDSARVRPATFGTWVSSLSGHLAPNRFYAGWLPAGLAMLWVLGLAWTVVDVVCSR